MLIKFIFNNRNSYDDMKCIIKGQVTYPYVSENYEFVEVYGRKNGSLTKKTKDYKDLTMKLNMRLVDMTDIETRLEMLYEWFTEIQDNRLYFEHNPSVCYIVKQAKVTEYTPKAGVQIDFTIDFTFEPFLRNNFNEVQTVKNGGSIMNNGFVESNPLITFYSATKQNIQLTIKDDTFVIYNAFGNVTIDSELYIAMSDSGTLRTTGEFPTLKVGKNEISWTGTVTEIKIDKRSLLRG